jgi:hypothetical protein
MPAGKIVLYCYCGLLISAICAMFAGCAGNQVVNAPQVPSSDGSKSSGQIAEPTPQEKVEMTVGFEKTIAPAAGSEEFKATRLSSKHGMVKVIYDGNSAEEFGGAALNAHHVLTACPAKQSTQASVVDSSGRSLSAVLFASNPSQGLCVLHVTEAVTHSLEHRMRRVLKKGESVYAPRRIDDDAAMHESKFERFSFATGRAMIVLDPATGPIFPGQPLYDEMGYLVGMFTAATSSGKSGDMAENLEWIISLLIVPKPCIPNAAQAIEMARAKLGQLSWPRDFDARNKDPDKFESNVQQFAQEFGFRLRFSRNPYWYPPAAWSRRQSGDVSIAIRIRSNGRRTFSIVGTPVDASLADGALSILYCVPFPETPLVLKGRDIYFVQTLRFRYR